MLTYEANELNQYTEIVDGVILEPEYDLDGNMSAAGDGWRYEWNGENRLILASNAQHVVTFAYDHKGRMVAKAVDDVARQYLWDGYNIIRETINHQQPTTNHYVWGLDLSGTLQGAGGVGGLLAEIKDGGPYYAAFDANGNVTEYISTNGVTAAHYEYSPFGEISSQSGDLADSFTHRFSTKPWCGVTGLSEYEKRKYGPGMGRWLSRDPIEELGSINLYLSFENAPFRHIDPHGNVNFGVIAEIVEAGAAAIAAWYKADEVLSFFMAGRRSSSRRQKHNFSQRALCPTDCFRKLPFLTGRPSLLTRMEAGLMVHFMD